MSLTIKRIIFFTILGGFALAWINDSYFPTQKETYSPSSSETQKETYSPSSSEWDEYQQADDPATKLVKNCASEAGIPENDPKHAITPYEMQILTDCIDRNR
jgi:hypothetical protein